MPQMPHDSFNLMDYNKFLKSGQEGIDFQSMEAPVHSHSGHAPSSSTQIAAPASDVSVQIISIQVLRPLNLIQLRLFCAPACYRKWMSDVAMFSPHACPQEQLYKLQQSLQSLQSSEELQRCINSDPGLSSADSSPHRHPPSLPAHCDSHKPGLSISVPAGRPVKARRLSNPGGSPAPCAPASTTSATASESVYASASLGFDPSLLMELISPSATTPSNTATSHMLHPVQTAFCGELHEHFFQKVELNLSPTPLPTPQQLQEVMAHA